MKKLLILIISLSLLNFSELLAKKNINPLKEIPVSNFNGATDNPKGKFKIRFIRNEDKSDTTAKSKGFFGKLKNIINMVMNASDNPPFKVEIVREKERRK